MWFFNINYNIYYSFVNLGLKKHPKFDLLETYFRAESMSCKSMLFLFCVLFRNVEVGPASGKTKKRLIEPNRKSSRAGPI